MLCTIRLTKENKLEFTFVLNINVNIPLKKKVI